MPTPSLKQEQPTRKSYDRASNNWNSVGHGDCELCHVGNNKSLERR